jgi:hypothetical protein
MSANDRAAYMSAPRPRAVSNRVDSETRGPSPLQVENKDPLRHSTSSQKHRASRDQKSMSDKRSERMVIASREKAMRRNPVNPVKESISAANRGDWDKTRPRKPIQLDDSRPSSRTGEKDPADCE